MSASRRRPRRRGPRRHAGADAELKNAATSALAWMLAGDKERAADAAAGIVGMGPRSVHVALFGWSCMTLRGFERREGRARDGEFWAPELTDETGTEVSLDEVPSPAHRDAARLVALAGNRDHDTIAALVKTVWPDTRATAELMWASLGMAAEMTKFLKEQDDGNAAGAAGEE